MARSQYIWVLYDDLNNNIEALFTVKHELVTFIQRRKLEHDPISDRWLISKYRDGEDGVRELWGLNTFLANVT